jgi:hypothetical protein
MVEPTVSFSSHIFYDSHKCWRRASGGRKPNKTAHCFHVLNENRSSARNRPVITGKAAFGRGGFIFAFSRGRRISVSGKRKCWPVFSKLTIYGQPGGKPVPIKKTPHLAVGRSDGRNGAAVKQAAAGASGIRS